MNTQANRINKVEPYRPFIASLPPFNTLCVMILNQIHY